MKFMKFFSVAFSKLLYTSTVIIFCGDISQKNKIFYIILWIAIFKHVVYNIIFIIEA